MWKDLKAAETVAINGGGGGKGGNSTTRSRLDRTRTAAASSPTGEVETHVFSNVLARYGRV